jgi:hypothetical protein
MKLEKQLLATLALVALSPSAWADDVTDTYLTNAGFDDEKSFETADVAGNTDPVAVDGWTVSETGAWGASATFAFGSAYQLNGANVPVTDVDGNTAGGVLGLSAGWGAARVYKQAVTLPAGIYTLTYKAYNANTATAVGTNKIGFVSDDGSVSKLSSLTSYNSGEWTSDAINFTLENETAGNITVGFAPASGGSSNSVKLFVDYIKIEYFESEWAQAVSAAKGKLGEHPTGAETEREAVLTKAAGESGDADDIEKLNELLDKFLAAVAVDEYNVTYADEIAAANKVEEVKASYPYTYDNLLSSDLTTWENNDYVLNSGTEHWSGPDKTPYYEQTGSEWGQNAWSHKASQTVGLPAGKYAMVVTARASDGVTSTMSVTVGDETTTVPLANNNAIGRGIATNGTATFAYDATYAKDGAGYGWKYAYIEFETTEKNPQATISFASSAESTHQWVSIANPVLYGEVEYVSEWAQAVGKVKGRLNEHPVGADDERAAVNAKIESIDESVAEATDEDIEELNDLLDEFLAAVAVDEYNVENADEIAAANEVEEVKASYLYTYPTLLSSDLTAWTSNDYVLNNGAQHWSGAEATPYYEQSGNEWGQTSWSHKASQSFTLPAGKYAIFVTARASESVTSTMSVTVGGETTSVDLATNGASGRGIALDGTATYAYDANYANNGAGAGWKYAYIEFETTDANPKATISVASSAESQYQWVSIANPVLYGEVSISEIYKVSLKSAIEDAYTLLDIDPNYGEEPFQRSAEAKEDALKAIAEAEAVNAAEEVTEEEVEAAKWALNVAFAEYNTKINIPEESEAFNIVMSKKGIKWNGMAATFTARADGAQGGYGIAYSAVPGKSNFNQAIHFVCVNENNFNLYMEDAEGTKHYICDGHAVGNTVSWADSQLRCTTEPEDALVISVTPSMLYSGIYDLVNTNTGIHIGSANDNGFYCSNINNTLSLVPAVETTITTTVESGQCGTIILPFAAEIPSGCNVYTASFEENQVVLNPVSELEACVPYIIEEGEYSFSGNPIAEYETYTEGLLTGVFVKTTVPEGAYVVENPDGNPTAVLVEEGTESILPANAAYLELPQATESSYLLRGGVATGVEALKSLTSGKAEIYDLSGRKLNKLQKGINIVDGIKILVK